MFTACAFSLPFRETLPQDEPMPSTQQHAPEERGRYQFITTHWSVVLAAGNSAAPNSHEVLAALCENYWFPLFAHVRRLGRDAENSRDLTQGFFAELLERNAVQIADPQRGRFRTFLLSALDNFLHHAHRDARAMKRGGDREFVSWDAQDAEQRLALEPAHECSPDRDFDRRWALATLERARKRLSSEFSVALCSRTGWNWSRWKSCFRVKS